jgi:ABC-type uncharacterized transport system permease subunit
MERYLLAASTLIYLLSFSYSLVLLGAGNFTPGRFGLLSLASGFALQTVYLILRGSHLGGWPVTNVHDGLLFLSWAVALAYLLLGATSRIVLLGSFTAPLIFFLQLAALVWPWNHAVPAVDPGSWPGMPLAAWLMAYGVLALAAVAGVMFLVQERQLKKRVPGAIFHLLPPLTTLIAVMKRWLQLGLGLLSVSLAASFFANQPVGTWKYAAALPVWLVYVAVLVLWSRNILHSLRVAWAPIAGAVLALLTLPVIFVAGGR